MNRKVAEKERAKEKAKDAKGKSKAKLRRSKKHAKVCSYRDLCQVEPYDVAGK